jgi:hypothetical protein
MVSDARRAIRLAALFLGLSLSSACHPAKEVTIRIAA